MTYTLNYLQFLLCNFRDACALQTVLQDALQTERQVPSLAPLTCRSDVAWHRHGMDMASSPETGGLHFDLFQVMVIRCETMWNGLIAVICCPIVIAIGCDMTINLIMIPSCCDGPKHRLPGKMHKYYDPGPNWVSFVFIFVQVFMLFWCIGTAIFAILGHFKIQLNEFKIIQDSTWHIDVQIIWHLWFCVVWRRSPVTSCHCMQCFCSPPGARFALALDSSRCAGT